LGFQDESGISEKPVVRTTWAPRGRTPVIKSACSWKNLGLAGAIICTSKGNRAKLCLRIFNGSIDSKKFIRFLKDIKRRIKGRKLLLFIDGLPAHRAKIVTTYIKSQKHWLRVERFPAYAPTLNPIEYLWSAMKRKDLAGHPPNGLSALKRTVRKSKRRLSNAKLLKCFLKASKLYAS